MTEQARILADIMCQREARKAKVTLKANYWNDPFWGKTFKKHIIAAYSILKVFEFSAIMQALKKPEAWWITSLRTKQLHDLIRSIVKVESQSKPIEITSTTTVTTPLGRGKNLKMLDE